ncbi:SGNH hydrolase [Mycena rebaudengoi]|nr:SGNH hydrolase [Mycena rebaudengoi]
MFRIASLLVLAASVSGTVYLAGDSTMAVGGGGSGTQGWGVSLSQYLTIPVVNDAVGGTSARSYSDQGRFTTLTALMISSSHLTEGRKFGHNDATSGAVDNGKQDAVGDGYNITSTVTTASGTKILIHSFAFYIENAINAIKAKGGIPIISSVTPDNIWNGTQIAPGGRFVTYAHSIGIDTSITYVDHFAYVAQAYEALGQTQTTTFYPIDHLHTSPAGALVVAQAFVRGLLCGNSTLKNFVNAAGKAVPNGCV